ncbi:MAG: hypothetical protein Q8O07_01205, partial [Chloroflexota bacterium]|nr:hypothetical protein [Chloroflexota bacterium]
MRLRLTLATLTVVVMLAASAGPPPVGGAEPIPTPQYSLYLPLVAVPPPTPTATATPTATPLPTVTPTPTATPTAAPTAPPGSLVWDWRLTFLNIRLTPASGSHYWRVTKGLFQDWNEGGGGHAIFVDVLREDGQRVALSEGTIIGTVTWPGGSTPLTWGAKPPNEYPVNFAMYGGLGSYTIWLTLDGLSSDQVAGMGLVATDSEGNLLPQPGRVHVNYLITFRR